MMGEANRRAWFRRYARPAVTDALLVTAAANRLADRSHASVPVRCAVAVGTPLAVVGLHAVQWLMVTGQATHAQVLWAASPQDLTALAKKVTAGDELSVDEVELVRLLERLERRHKTGQVIVAGVHTAALAALAAKSSGWARPALLGEVAMSAVKVAGYEVTRPLLVQRYREALATHNVKVS